MGCLQTAASSVRGPSCLSTSGRAQATRGPGTIAVVGLGGIGAVVAGCLQNAGRHSVIACARRPFDRIVLERPEGTLEIPLRTLTDPTAAQGVDWVLLCTKAHQTPSAAPWLARLCRPWSRVAVLQNGIGQVARTAPFVGGATVVPTVVSFSGERLGADRVKLRQPAPYDLGVADDADGRDFVQLFAGTPLRILLSDDLAALAWRKLLINAVANPITALTLQRLSVFRRDDVIGLAAAILAEVVAVARADGVRVTAGEVSEILQTLRALPEGMTTSMYSDRLAGRALELDALTGMIVAAGERLGISTPLNRAMLALLRAAGDPGTDASAGGAAGREADVAVGRGARKRPC